MSKKTKLLLAGGIAGFVLLVGVLLLVLWLTLWMPPSKADFAAAKKTADKIKEYKALDQLRTFANTTTIESRVGKSQQQLVDAVSKDRQKVMDLADKRSKAVEELRGSKVVRDAEVKKAFDAYAKAEARYQKYLHDFTEVYPVYRSSLVTCQAIYEIGSKVKNVKELAAAHSTASKNCLVDLGKLEKSPLPYAAYATKFKALVAERQVVFDAVNKGTLTVPQAAVRLNAIGDKYSSSKISPSSAVVKYGNDAILHGELTKLVELLNKNAK